tara:strand:- start:13874 stop:14092 length:219 start_codon:yes stop_codon:yes gene_type:complete
LCAAIVRRHRATPSCSASTSTAIAAGALATRDQHREVLHVLANSDFTCGLDCGQGNLSLGTKDAGLLEWRDQ